MKLNKNMCPTCPWREGSPYAWLREGLEHDSVQTGSRICHCTGSNAINTNTGKPERICRGARDFQLRFLAGVGFLSEATDQAWIEKCQEMGIKPDGQRQ